jgi:FkbM family methyltransferase
MFTISDFIFGSITHTALHEAKMKKLRENNLILPKNIFKTVGTDNAAFYIDDNIETIREVNTEYNFSDLRPTDNVLDIGACIGAFSLSIYKKVNHIYAIEPLMIDSLIRNIELNNAENITVLDCALGSGETKVSWGIKNKNVIGLSLGDIMNLCNRHIDFIKSDCEGGEWCMTLSEIFNVRRIEAEVHNFTGLYKFKDFENLLNLSGFDCISRPTERNTMLISAKNRYID